MKSAESHINLMDEFELWKGEDEGAGKGERLPKGNGVEMGVVLHDKEGEDGSVRDKGKGVVGVLGDLLGYGRFKSFSRLYGRFIAKHQLIRLIKKVMHRSEKILLTFKKGDATPVVFL